MPINILYADDDTDDKEYLLELLNELKIDFNLETVSTCEELLDKLENSPNLAIDFILLDINMPGIDGIQCLEQIRKTAAFQNVPVYMFTTADDPSYIQKSYDKGASLYVIKEHFFKNYLKSIQLLFTHFSSNNLAPRSIENFVFSRNYNLV